MLTLTSATLGDLLPLAVGMALSPQATILTLLWLPTRHGRLKALVLMLGAIASTFAVLAVLVALGWEINEPIGSRRLALAAGIVSLGFGLTCLAQVVHGIRRVTRGGETLCDVRRLHGLAAAFEHASWRQVFLKGAKTSVLDPRAPQALVPAAFIIVLHPLRPAQALAVMLVFSGVVGLGVATVLLIAAWPGRHSQAWLLRFRAWMEANGGAVLLGANALLAVVLFWKAFGYLH